MRCTDLLPKTKSGTPALTWEPCDDPFSPVAGRLTIETKDETATYSVCEFPVGWPGRGFSVKKAGGDTHYNVFLSLHGPEADSCDCKGATYGGKCRHMAAVRTLISNGWL